MGYDLPDCPVDLSRLSVLARMGWLYQVGQGLTATGVSGAQYVLWNSGSKGLPIWLISARVSAVAALLITTGYVTADPGFAAGNRPTNLYVREAGSQATLEAAVTAMPSLDRVTGEVNLQAGGEVELISPAVWFLQPGRGLVISSAAVASQVAFTLLWAEIENL